MIGLLCAEAYMGTVITHDECIKHAQDCSHQARQEGVTKHQRDMLYAMSRTWDTLARQAAGLEKLQDMTALATLPQPMKR